MADVYMPSPQDIARMCAEIQAGWTDEERVSRRRARPRVTTADHATIRQAAREHLGDKLRELRAGK